MASVVGFRCVGPAYKRGFRHPGWNEVFLDNGVKLTLGEDLVGFDSVLQAAEQRGHDATRMRERLDVWVKTGKLPAHDPSEPIGEVQFGLV